MEDGNKLKIKGLHIMEISDCRSDKAKFFERKLEECRLKFEALKKMVQCDEKAMKDQYLEFIYWKHQLLRFFKVREIVKENLTATVGRAVFARRLSGNTTYTGIVNYTALGSSNTAPAVGNTQLGTETYRKALSSGAYLSNVAYLETFFTATEVSGTFEEFGNFIDGTASANTGQLFNRFTQTVVKSATESLNVQSNVTFNDA